MDSYPRYSALQPSISSSTSELCSVLSQSLLFPSPASSFSDIRELGVFEPISLTTPSNSESNLRSLDIGTSDREMALDTLQRKLSLEFLNSNRRDLESEVVCWTDRQERSGPGKNAASTLLSLKKPILHNMSTVRSISPLPGVHTFRRKADGIEALRNTASGETTTDLWIQNRSVGFEQGHHQTHIESYSSSAYFPSHPHVYSSNGGFTPHVPHKPSRDISPMVTVRRDCIGTNPVSFPEGSGSNSFPVHTYPVSHSSAGGASDFSSGQVTTNERHQHSTKHYPAIKCADSQINDVNYGLNSDISIRHYDCSQVTSNISSSTSYGYSSQPLQTSSTLINRPIVVTASDPAGHHRVPDQIIKKTKHLANSSRSTNQCHICSKTYGRPSTLKTHVRTHLGDRPYRCHLCGKSFTQPANLTAHIRIHSGEKPFSCSICTRHFSQSSSLKTHMRTHSGERPYMCNICKKAFADSSTLTKHRRTHTGEKPYQCTVCLQQFSQSGNLKRHLKVHMDS